MTEFLEEVIEALTMDEEVRTFGEVMVPVFDILLSRIKDLDLCQILLYTYLDVILYFTKQKDVAKVRALQLLRPVNLFNCYGQTQLVGVVSSQWCSVNASVVSLKKARGRSGKRGCTWQQESRQ